MSAPAAAGETIYAVSSGAAPAAIAIIRISGPRAGAALRQLSGTLPPPRMASVALLRDLAGDLLDRALTLWMPGPSTSTGEDVVELHVHGSRATIAATLEALDRIEGLRLAEAGEFTRRALENGRMDLAQVEGLADLIRAETEGQRRAALRMAEGGLSARVEAWSARLLAVAAEIEASIEFAEEEGDAPVAIDHLRPIIEGLGAEMARALEAPPAERLRDGLRVVIAGPVNAGKSTLLNALAEREVAIATDVPGTTRDLIEVPIILDGMPFILTDSAGLRETEDRVEQIGIDRTTMAIAGADLILWLGDECEVPAGETIIIYAQADGRPAAGPCSLPVSARTGKGMDVLRQALAAKGREMCLSGSAETLTQRQRSLLLAACSHLGDARDLDVLIVAEQVQCALRALNRITGRSGMEQVLDHLFSAFCIGK